MSTQKGRETGTGTSGVNFIYKEGESGNSPYSSSPFWGDDGEFNDSSIKPPSIISFYQFLIGNANNSTTSPTGVFFSVPVGEWSSAHLKYWLGRADYLSGGATPSYVYYIEEYCMWDSSGTIHIWEWDSLYTSEGVGSPTTDPSNGSTSTFLADTVYNKPFYYSAEGLICFRKRTRGSFFNPLYVRGIVELF